VRAGSISAGEIVLRLTIVVVLCGAIGLEIDDYEDDSPETDLPRRRLTVPAHRRDRPPSRRSARGDTGNVRPRSGS
jgi:hypothetical protein